MTTTYATLSDLRQAVVTRHRNPEWAAKMLHAVPDLPTVPDRAKYLVEKATGQVVLDLGCTGPISERIRAVATTYYGIDARPGAHEVVDLDAQPDALPIHEDVTVIIASELLEHLANPGRFLASLRARYPDRPVYVTVPQAGAYQVENGTHEVVNGEHVAWYSYTTLKTLVTRYGYTISQAAWYHGNPHKAEGIIMVLTG